MAVHIGKIIQELVKKKGINVTDFAKKVNYSRRNIYEIFEKPTIDTGLLIKIGKVLEQNLFFEYLTDEELSEYIKSLGKEEEVLKIVKEIKKTVLELKQELEKEDKENKQKKRIKEKKEPKN